MGTKPEQSSVDNASLGDVGLDPDGVTNIQGTLLPVVPGMQKLLAMLAGTDGQRAEQILFDAVGRIGLEQCASRRRASELVIRRLQEALQKQTERSPNVKFWSAPRAAGDGSLPNKEILATETSLGDPKKPRDQWYRSRKVSHREAKQISEMSAIAIQLWYQQRQTLGLQRRGPARATGEDLGRGNHPDVTSTADGAGDQCSKGPPTKRHKTHTTNPLPPQPVVDLSICRTQRAVPASGLTSCRTKPPMEQPNFQLQHDPIRQLESSSVLPSGPPHLITHPHQERSLHGSDADGSQQLSPSLVARSLPDQMRGDTNTGRWAAMATSMLGRDMEQTSAMHPARAQDHGKVLGSTETSRLSGQVPEAQRILHHSNSFCSAEHLGSAQKAQQPIPGPKAPLSSPAGSFEANPEPSSPDLALTLNVLLARKLVHAAHLVVKVRSNVRCVGRFGTAPCSFMPPGLMHHGYEAVEMREWEELVAHQPDNSGLVRCLREMKHRVVCPIMTGCVQRGGKTICEGILLCHVEAAEDHQRRKEAALRERLLALKSSNFQEYLELVRSAKNERMEEMLMQTDVCLRRIGERLHQSLKRSQKKIDLKICEDGNVLEGSSWWAELSTHLQADIEKQPALLQGGELRDYQMHGVRWLVGLHDLGLNGILADDMGLGKTIQVIAMVAYFVEVRQDRGPFLVIAPSSVLSNWAAELKRWAPALKVVEYKGGAATREHVYNTQVAQQSFHVLLTSYEFLMAKKDRPRLSRLNWRYIIVDEGHRLKNAHCKLSAELRHYRSPARLLLTGTPLQNKLDELWALLNFLMPDVFSSYEEFHQWFQQPLTALQQLDPATAEEAMLTEEEYLLVTNRLHQILQPFMMRRLKESVATELPAKKEIVLRCGMSAYQEALVVLVKQKLMDIEAGEVVSVKGINNTVMELRNICNHPFLSKLHPEFGEEDLAPSTLPPLLRLCGKMELLDRVLLKLHTTGHKVLLFCTMTRMLDLIEEYLEWRGMTFLRLDGGTGEKDRGSLIQQFNAPGSRVFVFLLSLRAGGVGLNLQAADTVIMYDTDWNPQIDLQAQARAHRIGQQSEVQVIRLLTKDSIEEHIAKVAQQKRTFADSAITGGFFDGKTSADQKRAFLLDLLRCSKTATEGDTAFNDREVSQMLARNKEELEVFCKERPDVNLPAETQVVHSLATAEECKTLIAQVNMAARPPQVDDMAMFGRGMRRLMA